MISCCGQDCVVLLAPYPNNPNQVDSFNVTTDFDLQGDGLVWYARPQLFFNCTLSHRHQGALVQCIPCFIRGNSHPTIRHSFKDDWRLRLGSASADTQLDQGNGSRLYKVNIWMWHYCLGRPRMVSITEAERIWRERISKSRTRASETRK